MKNKIQTLKIIFMFALMSVNIKSYSQFTSSTNYAQANLGVNVQPINTGSDVYDNGTTFRVSVYGDLSGSATPGLAWDVNGSTGSLTFASSSQITNADVSLIEESSIVYAIVTWYFSGSPNAIYIQEYSWSGSAFTLTNSNFWNITINGTLYIDGNGSNGSVVVVYNDANNHIWAISGTMSSGAISYQNSGNPTQLLIVTTTGTSPDVSIYNSSGDFHVAYIGNTGNLYVEDYYFSALTSSTASYNGTGWATGPAGGFYFDSPRIASDNSGNPAAYTVVVSSTNHSGTYSIIGFNGGSSTPIDYNTGGTYSYYAFNGVPNSNPVVTYDNSGNVWVGWVMNNLSNGVGGTAAQAEYPIVVQCDNVAIPGTSHPYYWVVPDNSYLNYLSDYNLLSMAGRFGNDELYFTYYNPTNSDIYTKSALTISSISSFRNASSTGLQQIKTLNNELSKIPLTSNVTLKLFDLSGKIVFEEKGTADKIRSVLLKTATVLSSSVYLARLATDDGKYNFTHKIYLKN